MYDFFYGPIVPEINYSILFYFDYFLIHLSRYINGQVTFSKEHVISFGYIYW